jgi:hypothetical protein
MTSRGRGHKGKEREEESVAFLYRGSKKEELVILIFSLYGCFSSHYWLSPFTYSILAAVASQYPSVQPVGIIFYPISRIAAAAAASNHCCAFLGFLDLAHSLSLLFLLNCPGIYIVLETVHFVPQCRIDGESERRKSHMESVSQSITTKVEEHLVTDKG